MTVIKATSTDVPRLAPLFDAYRIFYEQTSSLEAAEKFLHNRLTNKESVIFIALNNNRPVGFTQLYFTFSSVTMESFLILNDLFVLPELRGKGIGQVLLEIAKSYCVENRHKGLALETAKDNPAQRLYEKLGWKKNTEFLHYFWSNPE